MLEFVSCIRSLPPFLTIFNMCEVNNHDDCCSLRKTAASLNVYYRKSVPVVLMGSKEASKQFALSVVTRENMCKLAFPVQATKNLAVASE